MYVYNLSYRTLFIQNYGQVRIQTEGFWISIYVKRYVKILLVASNTHWTFFHWYDIGNILLKICKRGKMTHGTPLAHDKT